MKELKLFFLFGILFFSSCVDAVFKSPQPKGATNLESFPEVLQGNYISVSSKWDPNGSDSIQLNIDSRIITLTQYKWEKISTDDSMQMDFKKRSKASSSAYLIQTYSYFTKSDTFYFLTKEVNYYPLEQRLILRRMGADYFLNFFDTIHNGSSFPEYFVLKMNLSEGFLKIDAGTLALHPNPSKKNNCDSMEPACYRTRDEAVQYYSRFTNIKLLDPQNHVYLLDPDSNQLKKLTGKDFFISWLVFRKRD